MKVGVLTELWRYPVKSMGGEMVASSVLDRRALHADRMWAVRDLELDAVTTARRLPVLLGCSARFIDEALRHVDLAMLRYLMPRPRLTMAATRH